MQPKKILIYTVILYFVFNFLVQADFTYKNNEYIAGYIIGRIIFALIIATFIEFVGHQGKFYDGASIYKDADGNYYYKDKFHTGKAAHIEIFNKNGKHLGEMKPDGELISNSADPKKILPKEKR